MKITEKEKHLLSQARPVTRKWLFNLIKNGKVLDEALNKNYMFLNIVEGNIYKAWHANCLADMKRIKLHDCLPDLFEFVADPKVTLPKALATVQKRYISETSKTRQKQIGKMIALLNRLDNSKKRFYHEATEQLLSSNKIKKVMEEIAHRIENMDGILNEYRLYTNQSIKHYNRLLKLGVRPSVHELYQCLDARFAADADIFTKQVNIVCTTYQKGQDVPADVKDVCFHYIALSLEHAGYLHANLIEYIFKNDEITERAFKLFCDAEKRIHEKGMDSLPRMYAHRLAVKKGLYSKPAAELTDSDVRILRIERMFKK